ncbi:integral membrane protein [Niveomyces insectorum RCEF 264]|uniref:Integral membrane protein n=1 Tax=Niveomyces insectorum RCEF 264 TaxID=1081102 RepID=A0A167REC9_9HYPO|nr:integral membrane protein [Niveomyces insectorum RCEF 264]
MASRYFIPVLVAMMLLTGVCNTLLTKYQDNQCVSNCDDPDPKKRAYFEQPVLQTAQMFIGETGSWLFVGLFSLRRRYQRRNANATTRREYEAVPGDDEDTRRDNGTADAAAHEGEEGADEGADAASLHSTTALNGHGKGAVRAEDSVLRGFGILLLALPSLCDILGTTLMNAGLLLVAASIYQMTRGALVLFVGLFSVLFLHRHLFAFQWLALGTVVLGVALVFTATQFVLEEWILERAPIAPLHMVGWEGLFGLGTTVVGAVVLDWVFGGGANSYFDLAAGWRQMVADPRILVSSVLIMVSIGGFNFFGLSVTRSVSATSRSTIDTCRTLFIWLVSLGLGWETFKWLQVVGFALLVYGTFVFNGIVQPPLKVLRQPRVEELLPEEPVEHM